MSQTKWIIQQGFLKEPGHHLGLSSSDLVLLDNSSIARFLILLKISLMSLLAYIPIDTVILKTC
jgi:hypothetical protein